MWTSDAQVPKISRLVVIDKPTGDNLPTTQKPFSIPYAFRDAVANEIDKILKGGLIETSVSAWASLILVCMKTDSTPEKTNIKINVDYLDKANTPERARDGDQDEIF